jgi:hypothetical protein
MKFKSGGLHENHGVVRFEILKVVIFALLPNSLVIIIIIIITIIICICTVKYG